MVGRPPEVAGSRARLAASRLLDELRAALGFLTRLPVARSTTDRSGAAAFPLVGTLVGVAGGAISLVVAPAEPILAAIAAIAFMTLLSGGCTSTALADTVERWAPGTGREIVAADRSVVVITHAGPLRIALALVEGTA